MFMQLLKQRKTIVDEQIDTIQESTAQEIDRALKELDLAVRTLELNNNKPEVVYKHCMSARFTLKNLALDLKTDARI